MFHNTTTLHRLNNNNPLLWSEKRFVNKIEKVPTPSNPVAVDKFAKLKVFGGKVMSKLGTVAKVVTWPFGGPILWNTAKGIWGGGKFIKKGAKKSSAVGKQAGKGVLKVGRGYAIRPMAAPFISIKRNLWDVPLAITKGVFSYGIAIAKTPYNTAVGARKGISNLFGGMKDVVSSTFSGDIKSAIKGVRRSTLGAISPVFTEPGKEYGKTTANIGRTIIDAQKPYVEWMSKSIKDVREGVGDILSAHHAEPTTEAV